MKNKCVFVIIFALVFVPGVNAQEVEKEIEIYGEDQLCNADMDCVRVEKDCTSLNCDCAEKAVNKDSEKKYVESLEACRASSAQPLVECERSCPRLYSKCIDKKCMVVGDGVFKLFYENGNLWWEQTFKGGKKNGISNVYYTNGGIWIKQNFKDDVLNGVSNYYYESGKLHREGSTKNGEIDGISRIYFDSGSVKNEWYFNEGKLDGVAKEYYEDGTIRLEMNYKDDKREGVSKAFYRDGAIWLEELFRNGVRISKKTYDHKGDLANEENFTSEK